VFSLTHTASGRLFGAYLDPKVVHGLLEQERQREQKGAAAPPQRGMLPAQPLPDWRSFEAQLHDVRARGLSRSEGEILPGISAMSAPVLDATGAIVLAVTAIGPAAIFDTRWDGEIARALRACADQVSQRLGATPSRP
jgi:DNA-binding IclR family transcriptional regulator